MKKINSVAIWHDIDLCATSKATIRDNKSTDTTSGTFD